MNRPNLNNHARKRGLLRRHRRKVMALLVLLAVAVGVLGWSMYRRHRQQRAVEAIRALGGKAEQSPGTLLDMLDVAHFVDLAGLKIGDENLRPLADLTDVRFLSLSRNRISDQGLAHLAGLTDLRVLDLKYNPGITDAGLKHLEGLTRLRELVLHETSVTPEGVKRLQKALPNTRIAFRPRK